MTTIFACCEWSCNPSVARSLSLFVYLFWIFATALTTSKIVQFTTNEDFVLSTAASGFLKVSLSHLHPVKHDVQGQLTAQRIVSVAPVVAVEQSTRTMSSNGDNHGADVIMPLQHVELADVDAVESQVRSAESSSRSQSPPPPPPSTETMADQLFTVDNDSVSFVSAPPMSATPSESVLTSRSPSPPPKAGPSTSKKKKKAAPLPVQLIDNLPIAREDALRTFTEMKENWYQSQRLGLSGEILEGSMCDCVYKHGACYAA